MNEGGAPTIAAVRDADRLAAEAAVEVDAAALVLVDALMALIDELCRTGMVSVNV